MLIQPTLLKTEVQLGLSKVFICGPGYMSGKIDIRERARETLESISNVDAIYGEDIENRFQPRKKGTDLQTLEAQFAHFVDFTLLILESPGSIAELGTFSQLPGVRDRLVVLVPRRFFRAESYIARGPLSLISDSNPNSVIYFDENNFDEMSKNVLYPLTFYKYAQYIGRFEYFRKTRRYNEGNPGEYRKYMNSLRVKYYMAITLVSIIVGDRPNYAELLLLSGLAPKQLTSTLRNLYKGRKIKKISSGTYQSINGYSDELLQPFSSTSISRARALLESAA